MTRPDGFYQALSLWKIEPNHHQLHPASSGSMNSSSTEISLDEQDHQHPRSTLPHSLRSLSNQSIDVLKRLFDHRPIHPDPFPKKRRAAVMVGLFASRHGHLNVLFTRRSKTMRTYAGQTALPGGKMEPKDVNLEYTARREAYEECGISLNPKKVRRLTNLNPFLSRGNLIVTPVVFFISDQTLIPRLNTKEVDLLFSHPLENFIKGPISKSYELPWFSTDIPYKLFEFPNKHSPITGFTADVMIEAAVIGYGREPDFQWKSKGQLGMNEIIKIALESEIEFKIDDQADQVGKHDILDLDLDLPCSSLLNLKSLNLNHLKSLTSVPYSFLKLIGLVPKF